MHTEPGPTDSALGALRDDPASRKHFLRMMGAGGASGLALLLSACGGGNDGSGTASSAASTSVPADTASTSKTSTGATPAAQNGDIKIVNYALTLEYLEADFYQQVIDSGMVKDAKVMDLVKSIGDNEKQHVTALEAAVKKLGGTPASKPKTNFKSVLDGGLDKIVKTAAMVENLGASAYLGQAAAIQSKEILAAALAIHTVEARHAAALNQLAGNGFKGSGPLVGAIPDGAFAKPRTMDEVLKQVKPFIA